MTRKYTNPISPAADTDHTLNGGPPPMSDTPSGYATFEPYFRTHYENNYANGGYNYDEYETYYRYGYDLARNPDYVDRDWPSLEPDIRSKWTDEDAGGWEQFKDAIRYAWERARNAGN